MKTGIELIAEERQRQIEEEGWGIENDARYQNDELSKAALCYVQPKREVEMVGDYIRGTKFLVPHDWPFHHSWWKPTPGDRVRELQKAGALIAAEIDRLNNEKI